MASREHKIVRRAEAMAQLGFLSKLLAEHFKIEVPDVSAVNRDSELAEIQRIENLNALLTQVLEASRADTSAENAESTKKPAKQAKHGVVK